MRSTDILSTRRCCPASKKHGRFADHLHAEGLAGHRQRGELAAGPGRTNLRCDENLLAKRNRARRIVEAARRAAKQLNLAAGNWIRREFASLWPVFLFFLVGFLVQLVIIKLAVAQFSIPVSAFSKALVGALLAAKAVLILDQTPLAHKLERYRRIIAVAVKTLMYGLGTLMLGYLER